MLKNVLQPHCDVKLSVKEHNSLLQDKSITARENYQGLQELQDVSPASHSKSKYQKIVFFLFYLEIYLHGRIVILNFLRTAIFQSI